MFLLDLIFERHLIANLKYTSVPTSNIFVFEKDIKTVKKSESKIFLVSTNKSKVDYSSNVIEDFVYKKSPISSRMQNIFNTYWQQTIFLSSSKYGYKKYIRPLRIDSIRNPRRKFWLQLSTSLLSGKVNLTLENCSDIVFNKKSLFALDIKYVLRKSYYSSIVNHLNQIAFGSKKIANRNQLNINTLKYLKANKFPIFVLANRLNEIVISEPSEELLISKSIFEIFYQWYKNIFVLNNNIRIKYKGWFFVNPQDASEFCQSIKRKYPVSSIENGIHVMGVNLAMYYKMSRLSHSNIEFRLIPDLNEVAKLVNKYRYYKHLYFHPDQKHGKDYFKGQPIYILQSIGKNNNNTKNINYYYHIPKDIHNMKYKNIFTSYDIAFEAWKKLKLDLKNSSINMMPKILVYNFEDFLNDITINNDVDKETFLVIPSTDAYKFMKKNKRKAFSVFKNASPYLFSFKLWTKRIIYSLFKKRPVDM